MLEPPNVHHVFNGGLAIQENTHDRRMQIRELVVALQKDVQRLVGEDAHVKVIADIKINISRQESGDDSKDHSYRVHVHTVLNLDDQTVNGASTDNASSNDTDFDTAPERVSVSRSSDVLPAAFTEHRTARYSPPATHVDSQERPNKRPRTARDSVDLVEHQPTAARHYSTASAAYPPARGSSFSMPRNSIASQSSAILPETTPASGEVMPFLNDWRNQWVSQGGWMYDQLTRIYQEDQRQAYQFNAKLDTFQTTLATANDPVLTEMRHVSHNLIPWLEQCRKAASDTSQAREEKWRTSSATFHDQNRRERDAAEKNILGEIQSQKSMLGKQMRMIQRLLKSQGLPEYDKREEGGLSEIEEITKI